MATPVPPGEEGIIPHLVVGNASEAIEFYKKAFGAEETMRMPSPDGSKLMHSQVKIGGTTVYVVDDFPEFCGGHSRDPKKLGATPVTIHRYVEDVDAAMAKAEKAGAAVTMPAEDMFWGDRYGVLTDPYGHMWSLATHTKDLTPEEIASAAATAFG